MLTNLFTLSLFRKDRPVGTMDPVTAFHVVTGAASVEYFRTHTAFFWDSMVKDTSKDAQKRLIRTVFLDMII